MDVGMKNVNKQVDRGVRPLTPQWGHIVTLQWGGHEVSFGMLLSYLLETLDFQLVRIAPQEVLIVRSCRA